MKVTPEVGWIISQLPNTYPVGAVFGVNVIGILGVAVGGFDEPSITVMLNGAVSTGTNIARTSTFALGIINTCVLVKVTPELGWITSQLLNTCPSGAIFGFKITGKPGKE
jgi:hypothetical protein